MPICALCLKDKELEESHIIPSFIINWLKRTSLTGNLRNPMQNNRRIQDGYKIPLLCRDCETIFSNYESIFNINIFKKFTEQYLGLNGKIKKDGFLSYDEWLNKFILSIVWRCYKSNYFNNYPDDMPNKFVKKIDNLLETWRRYLLNESPIRGDATNYLLFLRNIHEVTGELPEQMSPYIIHYLMRSIDGTIIFDKNLVVNMNKLGPIMLLTSINPNKITGYPDSIVRNHGKIQIEQTWSNAKLNRYLFIQRPNEIDKLRVKTTRQQKQVDKAFSKNIDRIDGTMTMHVIKSDSEKKA